MENLRDRLIQDLEISRGRWLIPPIYGASSISDLSSSRLQVISDNELIFDQEVPPILRAYTKFSELPERGLAKLLRREYPREYPPVSSAWVLLPFVRHFPNDREQVESLLIQDQTGELLVAMPDRIGRFILRQIGSDLDEEALKGNWAGGVILSGWYDDLGPDFALLGVNRDLKSTREQVAPLISAFQRAGVGLRG